MQNQDTARHATTGKCARCDRPQAATIVDAKGQRRALCDPCAADHDALLRSLAAGPPEHGVTQE